MAERADSLGEVDKLSSVISQLWENRKDLSPGDADALSPVEEAIDLLDRGEARVAEIDESDEVVVHEWLRQAILLLFSLSGLKTVEHGPFEYTDRCPSNKASRPRVSGHCRDPRRVEGRFWGAASC